MVQHKQIHSPEGTSLMSAQSLWNHLEHWSSQPIIDWCLSGLPHGHDGASEISVWPGDVFFADEGYKGSLFQIVCTKWLKKQPTNTHA